MSVSNVQVKKFLPQRGGQQLLITFLVTDFIIYGGQQSTQVDYSIVYPGIISSWPYMGVIRISNL